MSQRPIDDQQLDFEDPVGHTLSQDNQWQSARRHLYRITNPYTGNKRKIIVEIMQGLHSHGIQFSSILDLFSGSGSVSLFMKLLGKEVFSNDLLTSSYYNAVAFTENGHIELTADDMSFLCKSNNPNKNDFVQRNYQTRFTLEESKFLDNFRANIDSLLLKYSGATDGVLKTIRALCFVLIEHYVIDRCFVGGRLNNGQILANLEHRISHNRNDGNQMGFLLKPLPLFKSDKNNKSYNYDALEILCNVDIKSDLLYIDPPYGGDQSDYAQMYSFCEEYIYSKPISDLSHIVSSKHFSTKKEYEQHFRELLKQAARFPYWAVSYNDSSWANASYIENILKGFKNTVKVINIEHEYKYRKRDECGRNTSRGMEYLFTAH